MCTSNRCVENIFLPYSSTMQPSNEQSGWIQALVLAGIDHVEPIHDHHCFDQVATEIAMSAMPPSAYCVQDVQGTLVLPAIVHVSLDTHVISTQVLDPFSSILDPNAVFVHAQRLVSLADEPLIRLVSTSSIRGDNESGP